jgi:hypothetical protein
MKHKIEISLGGSYPGLSNKNKPIDLLLVHKDYEVCITDYFIYYMLVDYDGGVISSQRIKKI